MAKFGNKPGRLFEVSWEVCNKVGGIHTVIATKSPSARTYMGDDYFVVGPDLQREENVEFEEDVNLYSQWRIAASKEGIRVTIGRWKVKGSPVAFLIDISSYLTQKDALLAKLWEDYGVDSLNAGWDYVEPVLFGYASARAIEHFDIFYGSHEGATVAHFHEWMTASGVLYLKKMVPSIATVFTTHATVMGRCIAGNGLNLYRDMAKFDVGELAHNFNVNSKYTIEKYAAENSDCFTTVSQVTSDECKYMIGKEADQLTPNGFEDAIVFNNLDQVRSEARKSLIKVAEAALAKKYEKEPLIIGTSGRYEFKNKGLDEFIEALELLSRDGNLDREILAYILVPNLNYGARHDLQNFLESGVWEGDKYANANYTHYIDDNNYDAILDRLRNCSLLGSGDRVSVMVVPSYLNGYDGIFNKDYYEILPGFDLTAFPSYYEPWGYTPLESLAFGVPSVTTTLSGFGRWVELSDSKQKAMDIIERNDDENSDICEKLADIFRKYTTYNEVKLNNIRESARELSRHSLWSSLYSNYINVYKMATETASERTFTTDGGETHEQVNFLKQQFVQDAPVWRRVMIERKLPERLMALEELSNNLWWSWTLGARQLFEDLDIELWNRFDRNPIAMLDNITGDRLREIENDQVFLERLDQVYAEFKEYMAKKENRGGEKIAYFSMEYGLHSSLKIYSGGLGILAGDYLKEASDKNINMIAVGLLYRYGYFTQKITSHGEQEATYEAQNFYKLPIKPLRDEEDKWVTITLQYPGRRVSARIWKCDVGRTELYLLDTDYQANLYEDQSITHHLYGGDWENRLKQEVLLGMGGIKTVKAVGFEADVYHCNEGHAAFIGVRRAQDLIEEKNLTFSEALEVVRASSLFTTHTPVPAGHDSFPEDMIRTYFYSAPEMLKITWEQFISLGKTNPHDYNERFSMSVLACNMSQEVNGVSWLHGEVSKEILGNMWPGYFKDELHIGYVTNGVHAPTWMASSLRRMYAKYIGAELETHNYDKQIWQGIHNAPDEEIWQERMFLKRKLIANVVKRATDPTMSRYDSPAQMVNIVDTIKPEKLTIGFARRFATYKRAHLLFSDIDRLARIINNPERPIQFIFAGKAHPNDKPGQDLIKKIVEISKMPQFIGKIIFLQNYDMEVARRMVQGVDVWMNTPTRPLEASGTSGEKVVMNGGLHFSVLDGWWVEGYKKDAGWMLPLEQTFQDHNLQDQLDAELIYTILEEEIAPAYYNKEEGKDYSSQWIGYIKNSIADVASNFTTARMIEDYVERFYSPLAIRNGETRKDNFAKARRIAAWKRRVSRGWDGVNVIHSEIYDVIKGSIMAGENYTSSVKVDLAGLDANDIGVEIVIVQTSANGDQKLSMVIPMELVDVQNGVANYELYTTPDVTGSYDVAIRVYASNKELNSRMDFALVKWC